MINDNTPQWYRLTGDGTDPKPPAEFRSLAASAASALGLASRPDLGETLARDDGALILADGQATWLRLPHADDATATRVARAARAVATPSDPPEILDRPMALAHPTIPWDARLGRQAREGDTDVQPLTPPENGFVAINLRRAGWRENRDIGRWVSDEFNAQADTSKLRDPGTAVCRITVGAPTRDRARQGAVDAAVALGVGLDAYRAHDENADRTTPLIWTLPAAIAPAVALAVAATATPLWAPAAVAAILILTAIPLLTGWAHPLAGVTSLYLGLCALAATGTALTGRPGIIAAVVAGLWLLAAVIALWPCADPVGRAIGRRPRHWWLPFARRRRAGTDDNKTGTGGNDDNPSKTVTGYPLHRSTMILTPTALASLAVPPATAGRLAEADRAPAALLTGPGPIIGSDAAGGRVRIPESVLYGGIAVVGEPGSGKSNLTHGILAQLDGDTGPIIDFEMKGGQAVPILERLWGRPAAVCRIADTGPIVDILGDGAIPERAETFSRLMEEALGGDQIGPRSRMLIRDAAALGMSLTDTDEGRAVMSRMNLTADGWLDAAATLLGRRGIDEARRLARAAGRLDPQAVGRLGLDMAADGKRPMIPDARLVDMLGAPMNKLDTLLAAAPGVWDSRRPRVPWRRILDDDTPVIIDMDGLDAAQTVLGAMLLKSLRDAIADHCDGWQDRGRTITVACDELSILAGADGATPEWFREKGRSYGVRAVFATQNPRQLPESLMRSLLGFMTLICFTLRNPATAQEVAEALDPSGAWTAARVAAIARYHAVVRTAAGSGAMDAPVVRIDDFDGMDALPGA